MPLPFRYFIVIFNITLPVMALIGGYLKGNINVYFSEWGFITKQSAFMLVALHVYSGLIFEAEYQINRSDNQPGHSIPWALMSLGFLYLAFDEVMQFHERLDSAIHKWLGIRETGVTDRLDDVLILLFVLMGMFMLYYYRSTLVKYRVAIPYLIVGFGLALLMAGLDILTNRPDIIRDRTTLKIMEVIEELSKVFAELSFLLGVNKCWQELHSRSLLKVHGQE
jgi:hypothetical protein